MQSPLTTQFIIAFGILGLSAVLSTMGVIMLGLPLGLIGGFLLIKEMIERTI